ncbi:hypothetical protein [Daejeonella sp.]|jgi:hypothetical protein|uniref:hypothetical protein n=1 Tax=Daejeonella sp. TaxID=2805397 RepID=UPI0037835351
MKKFLILFVILVQLVFGFDKSLHAQESSVRGLIMDKSGMSKIPSVSILNRNTQQFTESDAYGLFKINGSKGDTLTFYKAGYTDLILVLANFSDLVLRMQPIIKLAEVKVLGETKKQELDQIKSQYRKNGSYYAGKPPFLAFLFQPLTAIYELVGKTPAQARRFNVYYTKELQQSEVDRRFSTNVLRNITGLDSLDLKNFMVMYRPDYSSLSTWDEYALINYIKRSLQTFNQSGRPKGLRSLPPLPKAKDLTEKNLKY